jgi:hypothetical protein
MNFKENITLEGEIIPNLFQGLKLNFKDAGTSSA